MTAENASGNDLLTHCFQNKTIFNEQLLAGKTAVISGAGGGIGKVISCLYARLGATVILCGRNRAKLQNLSTALTQQGFKSDIYSLNIREPLQVEGLFHYLSEAFNGLDVLINNAGGQFPQPAIDFSYKGWQAVIDTNLNGTWYMMQNAARYWRDLDRPGNIINMVTVIDRGMLGVSHTCAARAGVIYLSKSLAVEWAPYNIRINCVAPGAIESSGLAAYSDEARATFAYSNPMKTMGETWDIAECCVYLASDASKFMTGDVMVLDGGGRLWGELWTAGKPDYFNV